MVWSEEEGRGEEGRGGERGKREGVLLAPFLDPVPLFLFLCYEIVAWTSTLYCKTIKSRNMPSFSSLLVTLHKIPALFTSASYKVLFEDNSRLVTLFVFHRQSL